MEGQDVPKIFIANFWMKKILNEIDYKNLIDKEPINFKLLKSKTTPSKRLENLIEIDENIISQYKL